MVDWALVVEAAEALAWPLVGTAALILLRKPLVELVGQVAKRARSLSVFDVSIELATLPELQPPWSAGNVDVRRLSPSLIFDSASQTLFQEILKPARADYAIVDLASGDAWLTSRLYIFAMILGEITGLRAFVFLETASGSRKRFLGVATPGDVRRALGARYPWLEEASARAWADQYPAAPQPEIAGVSRFSNQATTFSPAEPWRVTAFVRQYVENLQRHTPPPPLEAESHLEIGTAPQTWERAHWIDGRRLENDLDAILSNARVDESPDAPRGRVTEAVLRRSAPFVALVDADQRFVGLVDRCALLTQVWNARPEASA